MAGETVNYYYLGHLLLALPAHALSLEPSVAYNLAVAGAVRALRLGGLHARGDAVGGGAGARRARRRRARSAPGWRRSRCASCSATSRARASGCDADEPARRLRLVRRLARDPGHDQRVPGVLVHARRPARARAGDPVHAARARVRAAGGARRAARRPRAGARWPRRSPPGSRSARCTRSTRGRIRSRPGCWSAPSWSGCASPAARGRRAVRRRLDGARAARRARARAAVLAGLRPGGARHRLASTSAARSARWAGDMALIYGVLGWARARRLRGPAAGRAAARADRGLGRASAPRSCSRCSRRSTSPASRRCSPRSPSRCTPRSRARLEAPERFLWLLIAGAAACVLAPELVYVRDEFDGGELYRMNTVFKLGYQAFLLLGDRRRLRAAVGRPLAAAPGVGGVGGGRRGAAAARARVPLRRQLRPPRRLLAHADARRARLAARERARRRRGDRVAARATRRTTPSCSRPSAPTTPASATRACPPSPAARP